jgi:hypothetical protein
LGRVDGMGWDDEWHTAGTSEGLSLCLEWNRVTASADNAKRVSILTQRDGRGPFGELVSKE